MNENFESFILDKTGATELGSKKTIQELWSGYGKILRVGLKGAPIKSVIVKHIRLSGSITHPRGWNTDIGHQRKLKSYQIETIWYSTYSTKSKARLPHCYAIDIQENEILIILEDLDNAGFPYRKQSLSWDWISACLKWLAQFHASYMGYVPDQLWEIGTYWQLDSRPQELESMKDHALKEAAHDIHKILNNCEFKTFVHGDAKVANFCFGSDNQVAAVDFQYVGGGCGIKDVAYFVGSCLNENDCERFEDEILDTYFHHLQTELLEANKALEMEWRSMYRVAWADFHRFLKGWSPGHWKINSYSERITAEVLKNI